MAAIKKVFEPGQEIFRHFPDRGDRDVFVSMTVTTRGLVISSSEYPDNGHQILQWGSYRSLMSQIDRSVVWEEVGMVNGLDNPEYARVRRLVEWLVKRQLTHSTTMSHWNQYRDK